MPTDSLKRTCATCGVLPGSPCLKRDGTPRRPHAGRERGTDRYPRHSQPVSNPVENR